jgi:hypothetical protein
MLVSTSVNPGDGALLAVVVSDGKIRSYYPAKLKRVEDFLRVPRRRRARKDQQNDHRGSIFA